MDPGNGHSAGPLQVRTSPPYPCFRGGRVNFFIIKARFCSFSNLSSKLQGNGLNENFLHYCEKWIQLLEKIQETLTVNAAHSLPALLERQKTYEVNLCSAVPQILTQGQDAGKRERDSNETQGEPVSKIELMIGI